MKATTPRPAASPLFNIYPSLSSSSSSPSPSHSTPPNDEHSEPLLPQSQRPTSNRRLSIPLNAGSIKRKYGVRTRIFLFLSFGLCVGLAVKIWKDEVFGEVDQARDRWREWKEWASLRGKGEGLGETTSGAEEGGGTTGEMKLGEEFTELEVKEKVGDENEGSPKWVEIGGEVDERISIEEVLMDDEKAVIEEIAFEEGSGSMERMNVRPFARLPSKDPNVKYLSFENHSGFHNQRKSLVNALVLSRLLNRTLLLPPARLGHAIPWGPEPDLINKLVFSEECKNGLHPELPIASSTNSHLVAQKLECDDSNKWTYVGWSWLLSPKLFEGRDIVDRWNSSRSWVETTIEDGGLGLKSEEIHAFVDDDRRSYQIYDSKDTPTQLDFFQTRIHLDDLLEGPISEKRLLQFGSLFSGGRLVLTREENKKEYAETFNGVILENEGLEVISNEVRDRLGSYVAVHARTGSQEKGSIFYRKANSNMFGIFRKLTHSVLGIKAREVDRMVAETKARMATRSDRRSFDSEEDSFSWSEDVEEGPFASDSSHSHSSSRFNLVHRSIDSLSTTFSRRAHSGQPSKPLSPLLHCRKPLHPSNDPNLAPLNTPLYLATDSRSPTTEDSLQIFFDWFPCIWILDSFVRATPGISDEPVPALERLVKGGVEEWISDFDGQEMSQYLFPFLESEIAARAVEIVGTPQSTFSGYTRGILHEHYASTGLLATRD